jgi:hypothetical protein
LTKFDQILTKYVTKYKIHVENFQERNFLRIEKTTPKTSREHWGWGGVGYRGGGHWGLGGGEGYGPLSRKLKFIIKSQAPSHDIRGGDASRLSSCPVPGT